MYVLFIAAIKRQMHRRTRKKWQIITGKNKIAVESRSYFLQPANPPDRPIRDLRISFVT
jgi:hypothetical protein